jgi:hypothetical protein
MKGREKIVLVEGIRADTTLMDVWNKVSELVDRDT